MVLCGWQSTVESTVESTDQIGQLIKYFTAVQLRHLKLHLTPPSVPLTPVLGLFMEQAVFDASAKSSSGVSLNDLLLVGPTVHSPLIDVLLRF